MHTLHWTMCQPDACSRDRSKQCTVNLVHGQRREVVKCGTDVFYSDREVIDLDSRPEPLLEFPPNKYRHVHFLPTGPLLSFC